MSGSEERMTVVFATDARKLDGNPLHYKTEFGDVVTIRCDDALDELTRYQDALREARDALETASRFYAKKSRPPIPEYLVKSIATINALLGE